MKISDIILEEDYNDSGMKALPLLFLGFLCLNILKKVSIKYGYKKNTNRQKQMGDQGMDDKTKKKKWEMTPRLLESDDRKMVARVVNRILGYRDEEWDAVLDPALMTRELFRDCICASARIGDYETFVKLSEAYPEYCEELFSCFEEKTTVRDFDASEILPEEIQTGMEEIQTEMEDFRNGFQKNSRMK